MKGYDNSFNSWIGKEFIYQHNDLFFQSYMAILKTK